MSSNPGSLSATAHVTLSPAERSWQEYLRRNDAQEAPEEPIWSIDGDCGRPHLSLSAACACANVRLASSLLSTPASSSPAPGLPALPDPARGSRGPAPGLPALPDPARDSRGPAPGLPAVSLPAWAPGMPASMPRPKPTTPDPEPQRGHRPAPTRSAPTTQTAPPTAAARPALHLVSGSSSPVPPATQAPTPPVDYAARILTAVQRTPLRSARAVFQEIGGNKPTVFETLKQMLDDRRLVTDPEGVYRVARHARRDAV